jgi:hypothetical protein
MSIIKQVFNYYPEVLPNYRKTLKVIDSCQTIEQFTTARRYVGLFLTSIQSTSYQGNRRSRVLPSPTIVYALKGRLDQVLKLKEIALR